MKVHGPLLSQEAKGTISTFLTFSKRESGQQARWQKKQKDRESDKQIIQRSQFLLASLACRNFNYGSAIFGVSLFGSEIVLYNNRAKEKNLSGYNLCISEYI
jgi:hypothetical protein